MNTKWIYCVLCVCLILTAAGCSAPAETPNVDATLAVLIASTETSQARLEATVDGAVSATTAALPTQTALPTYTPQPTSGPIPTLPPQLSPTPVYPEALTEEELANAVAVSVDQANQASVQTSEAAYQAAVDGVLTAEEIELLMVYASFTSEEINQAYALAEDYLALYGELAEASLDLLIAVEQDLSAMADSTEALTTALQDIDQIVQQGQAVSQEVIEQIQAQAQQASNKNDEIKTGIEDWQAMMQGDLDGRLANLNSFQPNDITSDRTQALNQFQMYLTGIKQSFSDGKISKVELDTIFQLGVNASASLKAAGGLGTAQLPGAIDTFNQQLARGQMPQARSSLTSLESMMPKRP